MYVQYHCPTNHFVEHLRQQRGAGVFRGVQIQRGSGFGGQLAGMFKSTVLPILKNAGKSLLKTGAATAVRHLSRLISGDNTINMPVQPVQTRRRSPAVKRRRQRVSVKRKRDIFD